MKPSEPRGSQPGGHVLLCVIVVQMAKRGGRGVIGGRYLGTLRYLYRALPWHSIQCISESQTLPSLLVKQEGLNSLYLALPLSFFLSLSLSLSLSP